MTSQENTTPTTPDKDPIAEGSLLWPIFLAMIVLLVSSAWALYDEFYTRRPYKKYQRDWVEIARDAYSAKLADAQKNLDALKATPQYEALRQAWKDAAEAAGGPYAELQGKLNNQIAPRLAVLGEPVKETRSEVADRTFRVERSREENDEGAERSYLQDLARIKAKTHKLEFPGGETVEWNYDRMLQEFNMLKAAQGTIQGQMAVVKTAESDARNALNAFVDAYMVGPKPDAIQKLVAGLDDFEHEIKQIHINYDDGELIERCESCHLGARSPVPLTLDEVEGRPEFASHSNPELLKIHDPEVMGCSPCHGGNGIATQTVEQAHGHFKHWLWPMYEKENTEAGCVQCHQDDFYLPQATTINHGRHLFKWRGCVGCHRHTQFIAEEDEFKTLSNSIENATKAIEGTEIDIARLTQRASSDDDDVVAQAFVDREKQEQALYLLQNEKTALDAELAGLKMEIKNVGPNLKETASKLKPEWLVPWLTNPRAFRPSTKMPKFRVDDQQAVQIAAYLWSNSAPVAYDKNVAEGDAERGEWLISTRGCTGCHMVNTSEYEDLGTTFAANLSRMGEKANYAYLVSWIANPRHHNQKTVMPSLRLSEQDSRDIATYLVSLVDENADYSGIPNDELMAAFADAGNIAAGERLVKHLGCAGCHEIKGLESEDRVGVELTKEGSKPLERLDFGTLTHKYKKEHKYHHKYFFEDKLYDPAIWDTEKYKPVYWDELKMPNFFPTVKESKKELKAALAKLDPDADDYDTEKAALDSKLQVHTDVDALTTFLLGSVEAHLPPSLKYQPKGAPKDIQEGWKVIKKYNCDGCHQILPGHIPGIWKQELYQDGTGFTGVPDKNGRPPTLVGQGTRTDPDWLMKFLDNPALTDDPVAMHRNGVRQGLAVRMPTFYLSARERGKLVRFFTALSNQTRNYMRPDVEPLVGDMLDLGRAAFTAGDCANCHLLGGETNINPATTYAPSFEPVARRIKPDWVHRWVTEPLKVIPGTAMPALLKPERDANGELVRWAFDLQNISATAKKRVGDAMLKKLGEYPGDHADLLTRYFAYWNETEAAHQKAKRAIN